MRRQGTGLWTLRKSLCDSRKRPQPLLLLLSAENTWEKDPELVTHVPGLKCYLSPRPYKGSALVDFRYSRSRSLVAALLGMTGWEFARGFASLFLGQDTLTAVAHP